MYVLLFKCQTVLLLIHAPINGGSQGSDNPQEFDCDGYPRVGILTVDLRNKPFVSANFDNYFLPGGGDFDNFFRKCQNPHPMPDSPPPLGIDIDRCTKPVTTCMMCVKSLIYTVLYACINQVRVSHRRLFTQNKML